MESVSAEITSRLRDRKEISVLDPIRSLSQEGSDHWPEADHLLFSGIEAYREKLDYPEAVKDLRASLAIDDATWREYADLQGPTRVRDACVYLGLARLEQGDAEEAESWFQRAATTDPGFVPDEKQFPPAARKAFAAARGKLTGVPVETSLDRLLPMAEHMGADVLVTGGVGATRNGGVTLQLIVVDRRTGESNQQSVGGGDGSREALLKAVEEVAPQLLSRVLGAEIIAREAALSRVRYEVGLDAREMPGAKVNSVDAAGGRYNWSGVFALAGVRLGVTRLTPGSLLIDGGITLVPGEAQPGSFINSLPGATLGSQLALGAHGYLAPARQWQGWTFAAGPGLEATYDLLVLRSSGSLVYLSPTWAGPAVLGLARRNIGRSAFIQGALGAEYDFLGHAPAPFAVRAQLTAGTSF